MTVAVIFVAPPLPTQQSNTVTLVSAQLRLILKVLCGVLSAAKVHVVQNVSAPEFEHVDSLTMTVDTTSWLYVIFSARTCTAVSDDGQVTLDGWLFLKTMT